MDPVHPESPVTVQLLEAADAAALTRCVERCYGDSYDAAWVYDPDEIARRIRTGVLRSCIGIAPNDEVIGHFGLVLETPDARVGEGGQAVVDPRYRGHHLFTTMKKFIADRARDDGLYGIFSEATAAHPYSQKANLDLGARETGLLLGYIPATVEDRVIAPGEVGRGHRQSVVLFYLRTNDGPPREIHPPARHRAMIERLIDEAGLRATLADASEPAAPSAGETRLDIDVRHDHNIAVIAVHDYGHDFVETVAARTDELCRAGLDCIYVDLPLGAPATRTLGDDLDDLGFRFGGIFPNRTAAGDVLRLQRLNHADVRSGDVAVASPLGRELLAYISDGQPDT